jgi:sterol desaturase/sphingolipid hydroxylase (fatty acid hydroxylase superfamily)
MKFEKIHNKGQAQLFKNKYVEMLTKTHPLIIWGMYLPVIIYFLYHSNNAFSYSILKILSIFFSGIFFWTFFEYMAHRFLFHWVAESKWAKKIVYTMHGNHHHYPRDRERLFMPPLPSIIITSVIFGLMYLLCGKYAYSFFAGFILGYLLYASMHYAIHAFNPPFKWIKPLWRNHHLHHYKDEHAGFGVSSTLWDHLFGTMYNLKEEKEDAEKVEQLMFTRKRISKTETA